MTQRKQGNAFENSPISVTGNTVTEGTVYLKDGYQTTDWSIPDAPNLPAKQKSLWTRLMAFLKGSK
jgi:nitrogen fixation protein